MKLLEAMILRNNETLTILAIEAASFTLKYRCLQLEHGGVVWQRLKELRKLCSMY